MKKVLRSRASSDIPTRELDDSAETIAEIVQVSGRNFDWVCKFAKEQVEAGLWEQVFKKVNGRVLKAYRRKA